MKCKTARNLIILDFYRELKDPDKAQLDDHIRKCPSCREELGLAQETFAMLDKNEPSESPSTDWDRAWAGINAAISKKQPRSRWPFAPRRRWALAGASLALVLIAGILIGKYWFAPLPEAGSVSAPESLETASIRPALSSHLNDLKPILLDYVHEPPANGTARKILLDEQILRGLLLQNILLKRALAGKDPAASELLDDLDLILKEIANHLEQKEEIPSEIRDFIEQRGILFKMEIFKKL
jgi:hypothetical protein